MDQVCARPDRLIGWMASVGDMDEGTSEFGIQK